MVGKLGVEHVSVAAIASESTNSTLLSIVIVILVFILVIFRIAIVNNLLVVHRLQLLLLLMLKCRHSSLNCSIVPLSLRASSPIGISRRIPAALLAPV